MRLLFILLVSLFPAAAQVSQLATDRSGSILLFKTQFRLQTESDVTSEQKIYRLQNGVWTRLTVFVPTGGIVPGSMDNPFVAGDGSIYGWFILPSHGLFPPIRIFSEAVVNGVSLPPGFPRESFRVSSNGRFIAGWTPSGGVLLDQVTGTQTTLPAEALYPQVADDGTIAYSLLDGSVVVRTRSGQTRTMSVPGTLDSISADARWVAIVGKDSTLNIVAAASGSLAAMLPTSVTRGARPSFSLSNTGVVYLAENNRSVFRWDASTGLSNLLAQSTGPFAEAVSSADGGVVWTVTETNRLMRFDLRAGTQSEVLPPLGKASFAGQSVSGVRVPGSAVLLPGTFTREQQVTVAGAVWPLSDVNADGYWTQVPWEWRGSSDGSLQSLNIRNKGNPFEDVGVVAYDSDYLPYFPKRIEPAIGQSTVIAAHQDFSGIVTLQNPARGGETVHVYMTGLGALEQNLPTGKPAPLVPLRVARRVTCAGQRQGSSVLTAPLPVPVAIAAGGMIGIYQVDVTIPSDVPDGLWFLHCGDGVREAVDSIATRP